MSDLVQNFIFSTIMKFYEVFLRFPLPSIFSVLFCILSIVQFHYNVNQIFTYLEILFLGFFFFIALKLYVENHKKSIFWYYSVGLPIFFIITYLDAIPIGSIDLNKQLSFPYIGFGIFLSIFVAPFICQKNSSDYFLRFTYVLLVHIIFTICAVVIFCVGALLIIFDLAMLLHIELGMQIYIYILLISVTFLSPFIAMYGIPKNYSLILQNFSKGLRFILVYIVLPLLLTYIIIIYLYIIKIILLWKLPQGLICKIVLGLACPGILYYLVNHPLRNEGGITSFFNKNFFQILLLPIAVAFYALALRINDYGITESRYFVLLALLWFSISTLFVLIKGNDDSPKFIVSLLVFLLIAISFGPLRASKISESSQIHRLENILLSNKILVNNIIKAPEHNLDKIQNCQICSIFDYFTGDKRAVLIEWLSIRGLNDLDKNASSEDILKRIGLKYCSPHECNIKNQDQYLYWNNDQINSDAIIVKNYDYYLGLDSLNAEKLYHLNQSQNSFVKVLFDNKTNKIQMIFSNKKDPVEADLNVLINKVFDKSLSAEDIIIGGKYDQTEWRIIMTSIYGASNNLNISAILLIKSDL